MKNYFVITTTLLLMLYLKPSVADVSDLSDQNANQEHLNPLNNLDPEDSSPNNQDKRTICGALNCLGSSSGHPKQVYLSRPITLKQIVGYAPVVRPVLLKPVGYRYLKPKIHFRLKSPILSKPSVVQGGWRPVQKPPSIATVFNPASHLDVVHNQPVPHVDHVNVSPVVKPVHVDHVHVQQVPAPGHLHQVSPVHVDQVHQVNVPHGNHFDTFTHIDHIHQVPAQPLIPAHPVPVPVAAAPPVQVIKPFIPSPVLFEVTKPNLGVLPIGARFPSPVLREFPHVHLRPVAPPLLHGLLPAPAAPLVPQPAGLLPAPGYLPQPGVSLEYHGTRNYLPFPGAAPFLPQSPVPVPYLPQTPVNAVQPLIPGGFSVHNGHAFQQLPFEHDSHGFLPQQQLPHDAQAHFLPQQQLPHEAQPHFLPQQQLPHDAQAHVLPQQQLPLEGQHQFLQNQYLDLPRQQLPLEGEPQFQNQEAFAPNTLNIQDFERSNVIQPGQTDVQIPVHLPQHHGWEAGVQQGGYQEETGRGFGNVFRPSIALEPPFKK